MKREQDASLGVRVASPDSVEDTKKRLSRLRSIVHQERTEENKNSLASSSGMQLKMLRSSRVQIGETKDTSTPPRNRAKSIRRSQHIPDIHEIQRSPFFSARKSRSLSPVRARSLFSRSSIQYDFEKEEEPTLPRRSDNNAPIKVSKVDFSLFSAITSDISKKILAIDHCPSVYTVAEKMQEIDDLSRQIGLRNFVYFHKDDQGGFKSLHGSRITKHLTPSFVQQYIVTPWQESHVNQTVVLTHVDRGYDTLYDLLLSFSTTQSRQDHDLILIDCYCGETDIASSSPVLEQILGFSIAIISEEIEIPFFPFANFVANGIKEMQQQVQKVQFHALGQSIYSKWRQLTEREEHAHEVLQLREKYYELEKEQHHAKILKEKSNEHHKLQLQMNESIIALNIVLSSQESLQLRDAAMSVIHTVQQVSGSRHANNDRVWIFFCDSQPEGSCTLRMINNHGVMKTLSLTNKTIISTFIHLESEKESIGSSDVHKPKFRVNEITLEQPEVISWLCSNGSEQGFYVNDEKLSVFRIKFPLIKKEETVLSMYGTHYDCIILCEQKKELMIPNELIIEYLKEISMISHAFFRKLFLAENSLLLSQFTKASVSLQNALSFDNIEFQALPFLDAAQAPATSDEVSVAMEHFAMISQQATARLFNLTSRVMPQLNISSMKLLFSKNLFNALGLLSQKEEINTDIPVEDELLSWNNWFSYHHQNGALEQYSIFTNGNTGSNNIESLIHQLLSNNTWLHDLKEEKIVLFNPGKNYQSLLSSTGQSMIVSNYHTARGGINSLLLDPRLSLLQFIGGIHPDCSSCLLLPIITKYGAAMILLFDRQETFWASFPPASPLLLTSNTTTASFTMNYAEMIEQMGLMNTIRNCIHQSIELSNVLFRSILTATTLSRQQQKYEFIVQRLQEQRKKAFLKLTFHEWKLAYHHAQIQKQLQEKQEWSTLIMDLVQFRFMYSGSLSTSKTHSNASPMIIMNKLIDAYLRMLEVHLGKFFPTESITLFGKPNDKEVEEELTHFLQKPHVFAIHDTIAYESHSTEITNLPFMKLLPGTIAYVVMTRPKSMKPFTDRELKLFHDICAMASRIYSVLKVGFCVELKEVDVVKEVTIPMMDHLLPMIVSLLDPANENIEDVFYLMIQWLKRMTEAEVVMFKVNHPLEPKGEKSAMSPWLLSSSDSKAKDALLLENAASFFPSSKLCRYSLVLTEDRSSTGTILPSTNASQTFPQDTSQQRGSKIVDVEVLYPSVNKSYPDEDEENIFGELKLILSSASSQESSRATEIIPLQKQRIIEMIMSLLMHTIQIRQDRFSKGKEHYQTKERLTTLITNLDIMKEELQQAQRNTEMASHDSYTLVKLCTCLSQLLPCYHWRQISDILWKLLPDLLGCESVLLAVNKDLLFLGDDKSEDKALAEAERENFLHYQSHPVPSADEYQIIWPSTASSMSEEAKAMVNSQLSLNQLLHVPRYFHQPTATQSVILFPVPGSKKMFAALLVFQASKPSPATLTTSSVRAQAQFGAIEKLQDLFTGLLGNVLYQSCSKFHSFVRLQALQDEASILVQERETKQKLLEEKELSAREQMKLLQEIQQLEERILTLQRDTEATLQQKEEMMEQMRQEQEEFRQHSNQLIVASTDTAKQLEHQKQQLQEEIEETIQQKANVLDLCIKFAYDDRCQPMTVLTWLEEIAASHHTSVFYFTNLSQEYSLPEAYQKINGLWAAIGEASRTGKSIRFEATTTDALTPNLSVVGIHAQRHRSQKVAHTKGDKRTSGSNESKVPPSQLFDVFCVPNRAILQMKSIEKYCFIFLKPLGDKYHTGFTEEEIDVLETAANLTARLLAKSISEMTNDDYLSLEKKFHVQQQEHSRVMKVIQCGRELLSEKIQSENELWRLIKSKINEWFTNPVIRSSTMTSIENSSLTTSMIVYELEVYSQEKLTKYQQKIYQRYPAEVIRLIELTRNKLSAHSNPQIVVAPLLSHSEFYGVMIIEKKFKPYFPSAANTGGNVNINQRLSSLSESYQAALADFTSSESQGKLFSMSSTGASAVDLSLLAMNEYDELLASIVSNYCSSILDKIHSITNAFLSVQDAGKAVIAVQESKGQIEERLAMEVAQRIQYEASVKAGLDFLAMACSHRMSIGQLSDLLKKSLITLTHSLEAFILLPYHCEALTTELLVELNDDPQFATSFTPPATQNPINSYYSFLAESPYPVFVHLEDGDMESIALQNFKAVFLPPESTLNHDLGLSNAIGTSGGVLPTGSSNYIKLNGWQSWAFRKSNLWSRGLALDGTGIDMMHDDHQLYAMAVPFRLSNGGLADNSKKPSVSTTSSHYPLTTTALIVLVRKNLPFNRCDLECVSWLGQTLSYCFSLKSDKFATKHRALEYKQLQREVLKLRSLVQVQEEKDRSYQQLFSQLKEVHQLVEIQSITSQQMMAIIREDSLLPSNPMTSSTDSPTKVSKGVQAMEQQIYQVLSQQELQYFMVALQVVFQVHKISECGENEWSDFIMPTYPNKSGKFSGYVDSAFPLPSAMQSSKDYPYRVEMIIPEFGKMTFKFGYLPGKENSSMSRKGFPRKSRSNDEMHGPADLINAIIMKFEKFSPSRSSSSTSNEPLRYYFIDLEATGKFGADRERDRADSLDMFSDPDEEEEEESSLVSEARSASPNVSSTNFKNISFKLELFYHYLLFYLAWKKELIEMYEYIIHIRLKKVDEKQSFSQELQQKSLEMEEMLAKYEDLLSQEKQQQQTLVNKQKVKAKQIETSFLDLFLSITSLSHQVFTNAIAHVNNGQLLSIPSTFPPLLERFVQSQTSNNVGCDYFIGKLSVVDTSVGETEQTSGVNISWLSAHGAPALVDQYCSRKSTEIMRKGSLLLLLFMDEEFDKKYATEGTKPTKPTTASTNTKHPIVEGILATLKIPSDLLSVSVISPSTTSLERLGGGRYINAVCLIIPPELRIEEKENLTPRYWSISGVVLESKISKLPYRQSVLYLLQLGYQLLCNNTLTIYHQQLVERQQQLAIKKLETIQVIKDNEQLQLSNSFQALATTTLNQKLQSLQTIQQTKIQKLLKYRSQALYSEQLLADWTELSKGLNGASSSIVGGSKGLWARSCATLLSVISGHCSVQNCGLILPKDFQKSNDRRQTEIRLTATRDGNNRIKSMKGYPDTSTSRLTEYVVRNITTPIPQQKRRRDSFDNNSLLSERNQEQFTTDFFFVNPQEALEYADASLQAQNVQDYGNKVSAIVNDIVDSAVSKLQRIYRLKTSTTTSLSNPTIPTASYIYLIPIKTARELFAILHIHTDFPLSQDPFNDETGDDKTLPSSSLNDTEIISLVENNLVYFSDLFAASMNAAQAIDRLQTIEKEKESTIVEKGQMEIQLQQELNISQQSMNHFQMLSDIIAKSFEESFITEDILTSIDQFIVKVSSAIVHYFDSVSSIKKANAETSTISTNRCLITINKELLSKMDMFWFHESSPLSASFHARTRDDQFQYFQEIHQKFYQQQQTTLLAHQQQQQSSSTLLSLFEELKFPLSPAGTQPLPGMKELPADSYFMIGYLLLFTDQHLPVSESLQSIMKIICHHLSAMILSIVKESIAKKKVTVAVETIQDIQQDYETLKQSLTVVQQEQQYSKVGNEEQAKWIQLLTYGLQGFSVSTSDAQQQFYSTILTALQQSPSSSSATSLSNSEDLYWKNQSKFLKYLESLLRESIMVLSTTTSTTASSITTLFQMNLILLNPKVLASRQLVWVYGNYPGSTPIAWNQLPENTKTIIMNLVNNCIEKKKRLSIEIRQIVEDYPINSSTTTSSMANLRLDVLPLFYSFSNTQEMIGVVQFIHLLPNETTSQQVSAAPMGVGLVPPARLDDTFSLDELDSPGGYQGPTVGHTTSTGAHYGVYADLASLFARILSHEMISIMIRLSYEQAEAHIINLSNKQESGSLHHSYQSYYQDNWKLFSTITAIVSGQFLLQLLPFSRAAESTNDNTTSFLSEFLLAVTNPTAWQRTTPHRSATIEMLLPLLEELGIRFVIHNGTIPSSGVDFRRDENDQDVLSSRYLPILAIDQDLLLHPHHLDDSIEIGRDAMRSSPSRRKGKQNKGPVSSSIASQYLEIQFVKNQSLRTLEAMQTSPHARSSTFDEKEVNQQLQSHANECLELFITFLKSLFNAYYDRQHHETQNQQEVQALQIELQQQQEKNLELSQNYQQIIHSQRKLTQEFKHRQDLSIVAIDQYPQLVPEILTTDYIEWKYHLQELFSVMESSTKEEEYLQNNYSIRRNQHVGSARMNDLERSYEQYFFMLLQLLNQRLIKLFIHRVPTTATTSTLSQLASGKGKKHQLSLQQRKSPVLKYHLSLFTLISEETSSEESSAKSTTKDSFKVRMYDQNQDSQELTILHYNAINRYTQRAGQLASSINTKVASSPSEERQSLVEKAFEINSVFFEEHYSHDNPHLSITDLIGIQDPDYHYAVYANPAPISSSASSSAKSRLQVTVMTMGIRYPTDSSTTSTNYNTGSKGNPKKSKGKPNVHPKTSNAVLRIIILQELPVSSSSSSIASSLSNLKEGESEVKSHQSDPEMPLVLTEKHFLKYCQSSFSQYESNLLLHHVKNICITFFSYTELIFQAAHQQYLCKHQSQSIRTNQQEDQHKVEQMKNKVLRYRKIYKLIAREANRLLDPPLIGSTSGTVSRVVHPANLTPLAASQDTCLKIFSTLRTLLKTEGQALLLKDTTTSPETFQVIYTGDAITWPGIEQNTFGVISAQLSTTAGRNPRASLVESVFISRKPIITGNGPADERYVSRVDGIMSLGTSLMVLPLRGRGGGIVGALLLAKYPNDDNTPTKDDPTNRKAIEEEVLVSAFTDEDLILADLISCFGSLSLFWCQGLGSLHHQLHKTIHKLEKLEKIIQINS